MKTVCCVMLANGREAMVERAVRAFQAQTHEAKKLVIWDTGEPRSPHKSEPNVLHCYPRGNGDTIGALRNAANSAVASFNVDIICHFDSDDWSHPNRIAEQVALLESSGKQAVGYRDMLFWNTAHRSQQPFEYDDGEAWLYVNPNERYCLGTSLCYWRSVWEAKPFPDLPKARGGTGEDTQWLQGLDSFGVASFHDMTPSLGIAPRMIASIHGANTMLYDAQTLSAPNFKRVPEWDAHCREVMAL